MSSKSILTILTYTISKLLRFLRHSVGYSTYLDIVECSSTWGPTITIQWAQMAISSTMQ